MCLFALTLELETAALDLAIWNPMASWDALPDASKEKTLNIYERDTLTNPTTSGFLVY